MRYRGVLILFNITLPSELERFCKYKQVITCRELSYAQYISYIVSYKKGVAMIERILNKYFFNKFIKQLLNSLNIRYYLDFYVRKPSFHSKICVFEFNYKNEDKMYIKNKFLGNFDVDEGLYYLLHFDEIRECVIDRLKEYGL